MIRRLADRLVSVDLLYQASELLQHQVEHRLQGAARAQVATRLAVIYMMDRKPDRALAALRATRVAELNNELRNQRLLLEARALSELGRHDVAIEVVANIAGREAIRLRSDILWAARKWAPAAEQIELLYGDRWQEFAPLSDTERADIMRAAIGYALGEDAIGLARFRERYLSRMGDGPDRRAFEVVTAPVGASGTEFSEIARSIAAVDTLEAFLRDLRARYPETGALPAAMRPRRGPRQRRRRGCADGGGISPRAHAALATSVCAMCGTPRTGNRHAKSQDYPHRRCRQPATAARIEGSADRFDEGRITAEALRALEDEAVRGAVACRKARARHHHRRRDAPAQFPGQFRRGGRGLRCRPLDAEGLRAAGGRLGAGAALEIPEMQHAGTAVSHRRPAKAKLRLARNVPLEEYSFVSKVAKTPAKVSLIGPDRISQRFDYQNSRGIYNGLDDFVDDVVRIEREIVESLVKAGCRYIHIDAPGFTAYVDKPTMEQMRARGEDPMENFSRSLKAGLGGSNLGEVATGIHLCRGNQRSMWHREGTYDAIAERMFNELAHDRFLLEYDTPRAGSFEPLRFVPKGKVVVLGLVSTKVSELETVEASSAASTRRRNSFRSNSSRSARNAASPPTWSAT